MNIQEYKEKLNAEVEIAEANLIHNLSDVSVGSYLLNSSKNSLEGIPQLLFANPLKSIDTINSISRQLFKPSHVANRILSKIGLINTIIRNLIK